MDLENKIEAQRKRMEQEKNKLDMLMKKAKAEQRKADNHRKIVVGANFETFLTEPRRYSEQQTRRIMQVAFATREVKNCMEQIERELAGAEQKMPDTAINKETGEGESEEEEELFSVSGNSPNFVEGAQIHHPLGRCCAFSEGSCRGQSATSYPITRCRHLVEQKASLLL